MRIDLRQLAVAAAPGLVLALWTALATAILAATLEPQERATLLAWVEPRVALIAMAWLVAAGTLGAAAHSAWRRWAAEPARLGEEARVLVGSDARRELEPRGGAGTRSLVAAFNALVRDRAALRSDVDAKVREASREIDQERGRLAALMSELTQSVVVCNLDGRILLYNHRARFQFRALSQAPTLADGAELIGLGRSIYAVFDRKLVAHALQSIQQRLQRGAANPSAQFVTSTRAGQLLRVQMAPVRALGGTDEPAPVARDPAPVTRGPAGAAGLVREPALNGFVLMLENITREFEDESQRDRLVTGLTESTRASLGTLQAAVEMLEFPDLDAEARERFLGVVRDEVRAMSERVQDFATRSARTQKTRWPLEEMLGADLVSAAAQRIAAQAGCTVNEGDVDASIWLKVDSFSLLQALVHLADRLVDEYGVRSLRLRLAPAGVRAHLDLVWAGVPMSTETVMNWETDPMRVAGEFSALSVRDVVERHGGEFWFERERVRHEAFFRFLLPVAGEHERLDTSLVVRGDSRPEYYDFDLFESSEHANEFADRRLAELAYTVFDTETTGLDPSAGDEIIQIGATRIVYGKVLRHESFEQLVDPRRPISEASIPIHGIRPEMVAGQPTIDEVLPAFHAFAQDTVLVAHNAAFDMRFLKMKEDRCGVAFDHPVLDTLLLSAVVHPQQEAHGLEAIAERLGVPVLGRHTALGDAMVTAEVFLKLVPLLAAQGIHTLGQARDAAQRTYYARLKY